MSDRVHVLPGSHNVRDLGGLPTEDGGTVVRGRMFRSDYPAFAEQDGGAAVRELGLRTVVDLRRGTEAAVETVDWAGLGVDYHRFPVVAQDASSWHARYTDYLVHRPESVASAVRTVLAGDEQPVLFHCAAGKDRTGVVAAVVLAFLGVPEDEIVADYVLTDASVEKVLARLAGQEVYQEVLAASSLEGQRPKAQAMVEFLGVLREQGGAEQWLLDHGLSRSELDAARAALVEHP